MAVYAIAAAVGLLVGVLSGMLGIGGGTIMVPVFRLAFGLEALQATATSLFAIIPTSAAGVVGHLRNKTCIVPLGVAAGLGGALLSPVGVQLANLSPTWAVMLATALVIAYSAITMLRKAFALGRGHQDGACAGPAGKADADAPQGDVAPAESPGPVSPSVGHRGLAIGFLIGMAAGLMSGYVGVGGGFLMVPLFVSVLGIPMKKTSGTSLIAITILAIPGVVRQAMLGNVVFGVGLVMAAGSIPGAVLGANLVRRIPERALRLAFGAVLLVTAVILAVNEF